MCTVYCFTSSGLSIPSLLLLSLKPLLARSFQKLKHSLLQESPRNFWGNVENVDYVLGDRLVLMLGCPSIVSFRKQSDDITTFLTIDISLL